jgi:hypothetical protein
MRSISLDRIPAQTFTVVLSGRDCTLSLYWRQERLYLDLDVGSTAICRGAICQNRADIVRSRSGEFAGSLCFFDREGDDPPRWEGLHNGASSRWALLFLEDGEEIPESLR